MIFSFFILVIIDITGHYSPFPFDNERSPIREGRSFVIIISFA
ncbi:hypothetical protein B4102_3110 [Heyndrickxia sporothermodurans]|uniref:Uncharacterized protein n=1 Tax=Heyndrickxia sporothermodurans TaxID=46224 RepID=A0A150L0T3_9BACI|nr:hypothetical protein B4102_3110 [Heyndrickxia sporothermodurans]